MESWLKIILFCENVQNAFEQIGHQEGKERDLVRMSRLDQTQNLEELVTGSW